MLPLAPPALHAPAETRRVVLAMGTRLEVRLSGRGAERASRAALDEAARIESACSTWRGDSPWARLNATGQASLDPEWIELLSQAKAWSGRTGGAFDPVLGRLIVEAWGLRSGGRTPTSMELESARGASGAGHLSLEGGIASLSDGAWIEEGGFLKGYALDRAMSAAKTSGASSGLLDFGGQLLAWGVARSVSVADPLTRATPRIRLRLAGASLSCSGTSERGRHILDPGTGKPCPAWGSVAVVAPSGLEADILSTALYVMGPERGLAWATRESVGAAFLLADGSIRLSPAFRSLHPTLLPKESR